MLVPARVLSGRRVASRPFDLADLWSDRRAVRRPRRLSEGCVTEHAHSPWTLTSKRSRKSRFSSSWTRFGGAASLSVRARGLRQARVAGHPTAERQALIDLAAVCVALAARLPAPRLALAESDRGPRAPRSPSTHTRPRAA